MTTPFLVACVQYCATDDLAANLAAAEEGVRRARAAGASLILLPENLAQMYPRDELLLDAAHTEEEHPALPRLQALARELACHLLLGSLSIKRPSGRIHNRSYLLGPAGEVVATYDKIHLFDVALGGGEVYRESQAVEPGDRLVVAETPWGGLGLSICYDLRFAYLYRALAHAGAAFLSVPAAFTQMTGEAHWHTLLRARAIETGCYVFASGQCGVRPWGRATYGHSLIVDPWGHVLADAGPHPGICLAEVVPARVAEVRGQIPALRHDRLLSPPAGSSPPAPDPAPNGDALFGGAAIR
jgi:predicted amidohydrolase